jgi:hypothetical protein
MGCVRSLRWKQLLWQSPPLIAGVMLSSAAVLKIYQVESIDQSSLIDRWLHSWISVTSLATIEFIIAAWLISGIFPTVARYVSIILFSTFSVVSITKALDGEVSCGCFGVVTISPWIMAVVDIILVIAMITSHPVSSKSLLRSIVAVGLILLAAVLLLIQLSAEKVAIVVNPSNINFGRLRQAERHEVLINISNKSSNDIVLSHFSTSCPCASIVHETSRIRAGETVEGMVVLDLTREPNFRGALSITVIEFAADRPAFKITINAVVEP